MRAERFLHIGIHYSTFSLALLKDVRIDRATSAPDGLIFRAEAFMMHQQCSTIHDARREQDPRVKTLSG